MEMGENLYTEFIGSGLCKELFGHVWRNPNSSWIDDINTEERESFETYFNHIQTSGCLA